MKNQKKGSKWEKNEGVLEAVKSYNGSIIQFRMFVYGGDWYRPQLHQHKWLEIRDRDKASGQ